jgi:diguanylate cyclase (GGDEF)-like protein
MKKLLVIVFISLATSLFAEEKVLTLTADKTLYRLGGFISILEDPEGAYTLEEVREMDDQFELFQENEPNLGFSDAVYWVKLTVEEQRGVGKEWLLELGYPPMDHVEFFYQEAPGGEYDVYVSGDTVPTRKRVIPHRNHLFPIDPAPGEPHVYYLRVDSESSIVFPLRIWGKSRFSMLDSKNQLLLGLFFGLLFIMVLYNMPLFISSRERAYLYYILFVASNIVFQLAFTGVGLVYLWPNSPWWANYSLPLFGSLSVTFAILFTINFLQTRRWTPRLHKLLYVFVVISLANSCLSPIIPYWITIQITNFLLIVVAGISIFTALLVYRKGYVPARYYFLAWMFLFAAVIIVAFKNLGVLPSTAFTSSVLQTGMALEVILLSIALADRIAHLRKSREKAEQEKLQHQQIALQATEEKLYKDNLTGLPNRNSLIRDIDATAHPSLFLINIDHFKEVNDLYGNTIGDQLLVLLGKRVEAIPLSFSSTVYRLHADEFALLIPRPLENETMEEIGKMIYVRCQEEPYKIGDRTIRLEVSIGIASGKDNLLEKADMALTQSRETQLHFCLYNTSMGTKKQYENNLKWIDIIRASIAENRVIPVFQPILHNKSNTIEKYETLIRLQNSNQELITPGSFLSIAKKAKLYPYLSRIVINKSFEICSTSTKEFSINLSVDDLNNRDTLDLIRELCNNPQVKNRIVFEIVESEGISNYEEVASFIEEMKSKGMKIAIDDFGTGYSNFEYILRLDVDYIKIDASLIKNIHTDTLCRYVTETILDLSKKLKIKPIAEFVHNEEVFAMVNQLDVDYSQGFYIGKPEAASNISL